MITETPSPHNPSTKTWKHTGSGSSKISKPLTCSTRTRLPTSIYLEKESSEEESYKDNGTISTNGHTLDFEKESFGKAKESEDAKYAEESEESDFSITDSVEKMSLSKTEDFSLENK